LILIVETIPQIIHDLYKELTLLGYPVVVARTGTEALEKARQLHPGRIFLNPLLPLLSGWDVLNLLKSDAETASIPIIIINHQENPFPQEFDRAAGFLSLPLELEKLKVLLPEAPPLKAQNLTKLTILQLYLPNQPEDTSLNLLLGAQLSNLNCRLLSASSLEQGEMIASVWDVDVVILDGNLETDSGEYLQHLSHCQHLANLPLVTLGQNLTESANKVSNLAIFPCLLPPGENNVEQLIQIIEIAAQSHR
jgi:DNA-binding response OmpR family regulator